MDIVAKHNVSYSTVTRYFKKRNKEHPGSLIKLGCWQVSDSAYRAWLMDAAIG